MCVGAMLNTSSQFSHDSADQAAKTRGVAQIAAIWRARWPMMGCMGWVDCAATCIHALSNKWGLRTPSAIRWLSGRIVCARGTAGEPRGSGAGNRATALIYCLVPALPRICCQRAFWESLLFAIGNFFLRVARAGVNCFLSKQSHLRKGIPGGNHHIRCGTNCAHAKHT